VDLSIIVPAYNEEHRLGDTLTEIAAFLAPRSEVAEVIVIDDGSTDRTGDVARASSLDPTVIRTEPNRGKGHAVRVGMLAASGSLRLFTDADGSTPIDEYDRLHQALKRHGSTGIAIASVAVEGADVVTPQRGIRPAAGRLGNRIIQSLVLPGVADSQRGFKLFAGDAAETIFERCVVDRWAFDVEVLAVARALGVPFVEVPVTWMHKDDSRVTPASYVTTLWDVMRIRRRLARGSYGAAAATSQEVVV
jgi:dolichyl-phosphate beta-glucosyltransferase